MTLDDWYAQNQGKGLLVPGEPESERGQCVQAVDYVLHDVYGLPYHYGNAIDWWNNPGELMNNFIKVSDGSVKKGDFVVFNTMVGSQYGHIDVAMQDGSTSGFQGADSNWGGNLTVHLVQHNNPNYVLGSLRRKNMPTLADHDMVDRLATMAFNDTIANNPDLKFYIGQPIDTVVNILNESAERAAYLKHIQDLENNAGTVLAPGKYQVK